MSTERIKQVRFDLLRRDQILKEATYLRTRVVELQERMQRMDRQLEAAESELARLPTEAELLNQLADAFEEAAQ